MTISQAYKRYNKTLYGSVNDPKQIVSLLFGAALKETAEARTKLESGNGLNAADNINKTVEILSALSNSLDKNSDKETVEYLSALYAWLSNKLLEGFRKKNIEDIKVVERYLSQVHRIWNDNI